MYKKLFNHSMCKRILELSLFVVYGII